MNYRAILLSSFLLLSGAVSAQQISVREAQSKAYDFVKKQEPKRAAHRGAVNTDDLQLVYTRERASDQRALYYVFGLGQEGGYVIMGGDESAREVLAYSEHGTYDPEHMAPAFVWWLEQFEQQISAAIDQGPVDVEARRQAVPRTAATSRHSIEPLLTTTWGQDEPYNNAIIADIQRQCNTTARYNYVTGCVATAMAQVMNYHEWPTQGTGEKSDGYKFSINNHVWTPYANFAETTYDWANMRDSYANGSYSDAEAQAVATLMYHAGVSVDMKYGPSSGALSQDIPGALSTYFGYDRSALYRGRDYYTDAQWEEMVYQELANGRPVLYGGSQPTVGHQFVCCGYDADADLYYFNWGWNGSSDDYCPLSGTKALTPVGTGTGGGNANTAYTIGQDIIINVKPDEGGAEIPSVLQYDHKKDGTDFVMLDGSVAIGNYDYETKSTKRLTLKVTMENASATMTSFQLGVKGTEKNSGMVHYWPGNTIEMERLKYVYYTETLFDLNQLTYNGIYEISPIVRPAGSTSDNDWVEVPVLNQYTQPTVTMTCGQALQARDITFGLEPCEVSVSRSIWVTHDETYQGEVTYTSSDPTVAVVDAEGKVTGVKVGKTTITAAGEEMMFAGSKLYNATTATFEVTVTDLIKDQVKVSLMQTYLAQNQTAQIEWTDGYDGVPQFTSSNTKVATVDANGVVKGIKKGTATVTAVLPETAYWMGATAEFEVTVTSSSCYLTMKPYFDNDNNPYADNRSLHVALCNTQNQQVTAVLLCAIYQLQDGAEYYMGYTGFGLTFPDSGTFEDVVNLPDWGFVADGNYRIRFWQDTNLSTPWNVEYIDFVWRDALEVPYTLTTAGVGTVMLPFDAALPKQDNDGKAIKWKAYSCQSLDESGKLNLIAATELKRNTPYVLMGDAATYTFRGPKAVEGNQYADGLLTGALVDQQVAFRVGDYILQNHEGRVAFYRYDPTVATPNNGYCKPYRAFVRTGAMNEMCLAFDIIEPETEAIETVMSEKKRPAGIYGLDGKLRESLQVGINVVVDAEGATRKVYVK